MLRTFTVLAISFSCSIREVVSKNTSSVCLPECPIGHEAITKCENSTGYKCKKCSSGYFNDQNGGKCRLCKPCGPGEYVRLPCDAHNAAVCAPCDAFSYADRENTERCKSCSDCPENRNIAKNCTRTADTVCGDCSEGFFFHIHQHVCLPCSYCFDDGETINIEVEECRLKESVSRKICMPAVFPAPIDESFEDNALPNHRTRSTTPQQKAIDVDSGTLKIIILVTSVIVPCIMIISVFSIIIKFAKKGKGSQFRNINKDFVLKNDKPFQHKNSALSFLSSTMCESRTTVSTRISTFSDNSTTEQSRRNGDSELVHQREFVAKNDKHGQNVVRSVNVSSDCIVNPITSILKDSSTLVSEKHSVQIECHPSTKKRTSELDEELCVYGSHIKPPVSVESGCDISAINESAAITFLKRESNPVAWNKRPHSAVSALCDDRIEFSVDSTDTPICENRPDSGYTIKKRWFLFPKPKIFQRRRWSFSGELSNNLSEIKDDKDSRLDSVDKRDMSLEIDETRSEASTGSQSIDVPMNENLIETNVV